MDARKINLYKIILNLYDTTIYDNIWGSNKTKRCIILINLHFTSNNAKLMAVGRRIYFSGFFSSFRSILCIVSEWYNRGYNTI